MFTKKKIVLSIIGLLIISFLIWIVPDVIKYRKTVKASGTYPFQIGITNAFITPCVLTLGVCVGGGDPVSNGTCNTKGPGICTTYSHISGIQSGGMGSFTLLNNMVVAKTGLTSGMSLIAGGMSPVLMDSGVAASVGGTAFGLSRKIDKIIDLFDYIIAGFRK